MSTPRVPSSPSRGLLGTADVPDVRFAAMVAEQLGVERADVLDCEVSVAEYDIEALTTAGRFWVRGTARHEGGTSPFAFFVKVVQSWTRSPAFAHAPDHLREVAATGLPWRTEPAIYRSDLADRLPPGFSMPAAHAVVDLDEESAALWLAGVDVDTTRWQAPTFERAAHGLGRLAGSAAVAPLRALGSRDVVRGYAGGRLRHQVVPALRDPRLWDHPAIADAFDPELRARITAVLDAVPDLAEELSALPLGTAHGDATPRNLLRTRQAPDAFVLIDFTFLCEAPLGFDLSQLLLGEVQLGERSALELPDLAERCLTAYVDGLRDEGCDASPDDVRRAQALVMLLFVGLSAAPVEVLFGMPAPGGPELLRERADAARLILDLVDRTAR
jgi:hypothetical protein